ncbi:MAG: DUF1800 domain-containing protein [Anaerolineae bacterium]
MELTRRRFLQYSGAAALALMGGATAEAASHSSAVGPLGALGFPWSARTAGTPPFAVHVLSRFAYGHTAADMAAIQSGTFDVNAWFEQQLYPDDTESDTLTAKLNTLESISKSAYQLFTDYPQTAAQQGGPSVYTVVMPDIVRATLLRKVYSKWQVKEVMVDFWTDHFNIDYTKDLCKWTTTVHDRDHIRPNALGNFKTLLMADAKSAAMMDYLDNWENHKRAPNENYAREIMELHTLGVDGGYTQQDVQQLARVLTGWTYYRPQLTNIQPNAGVWYFNANDHDTSNKLVLGNSIAGQSGTAGIQEGEQVIDILANHRSTAHFIAKKLCRKFVSDTPSDSLINSIADVFYSNRSAPDQIAIVLRAILDSDEFKNSTGQKAKRPLDFIPAAMRAVDCDTLMPQSVWRTGSGFPASIGTMGQPLFNHGFPNGYPDTAADWVNSNDLLARWNFSIAMMENKLGAGTTTDLKAWVQSINPTTADALVDAMTMRVLGYAIDAADRTSLVNYVSNNNPAGFQLNNTVLSVKVPELAALLLASPYFQAR